MSCPATNPADVNPAALESEIRNAVINRKANACPMIVRLAWHASGTFCNETKTGGSNGATMRWPTEANDDANAGLSISRDMLLPVKQAHPELSHADLWTFAGAKAVEFCGGPRVPFNFGRTDEEESGCPPNGRLPDAAQGADHIREVFYRMGFNDQEIVALVGAHTLGRCHRVRSGFDGPWTRHPLKFDNQYFKNLMFMEWRPKQWDGPLQYEDVATGELMMLPADMALRTDPEFAKWSQLYAEDEAKFFEDFANAFAKLISLGCPEQCAPGADPTKPAEGSKEELSEIFREHAMHGTVWGMKMYKERGADVHAIESNSGRTALHKAAFWGHVDATQYLLQECGIDINLVDYNGDTALHDAARFGHVKVVELLLAAGADASITNKAGMDVLAVAKDYSKADVVAVLQGGASSRL